MSGDLRERIAPILDQLCVEFERLWEELGRTKAELYEIASQAQGQDYQVLTLAEAAESIGVSVATVREWTKLPAHHPRHLPYVMINGKAKGVEVEVLKVFVRRKTAKQ